MAMIPCPECNGNISDKARFCVHCGCKVVVCPECGATYVGSATSCKECGFVFEKQTPPAQTVQPAQPVTAEKKQTIQDVYEAWKRRGKSGLNVADSVFFWIRMGLVGLMILAIIFWRSSIMTLLAVRFLLLTAALCTVIRVVLGIIDTIQRHSEKNSFSAWCMAKGINVKPLIKESLEIDKKKLTEKKYRQELVDIKAILNKCSALNSKAIKTKEIVEDVLDALCSLAFSWCFVKFLTRNISIYVIADKFKFSMLEGWRLFIIPGAFFVITVTWSIIGDTIEKRARDKWMKTNLPETEALYNEVMKDLKQYEDAVEEDDEDKVEIVR